MRLRQIYVDKKFAAYLLPLSFLFSDIEHMEEIGLQWQEKQKAFRQGYVMTFTECYYASGMYMLDPVMAHPLFVERIFPAQYPEEKLIPQLNAMGARFRLLPSHPNN